MHYVNAEFVYPYEHTEWNSDYIAVVVRVGYQIVAIFGDRDHDKGDERAEGFVYALKSLLGEKGLIVTTSSTNATEDRPDSAPYYHNDIKTLKEVLCLDSPQNTHCSCSSSTVPVAKPQSQVATPSAPC